MHPLLSARKELGRWLGRPHGWGQRSEDGDPGACSCIPANEGHFVLCDWSPPGLPWTSLPTRSDRRCLCRAAPPGRPEAQKQRPSQVASRRQARRRCAAPALPSRSQQTWGQAWPSSRDWRPETGALGRPGKLRGQQRDRPVRGADHSGSCPPQRRRREQLLQRTLGNARNAKWRFEWFRRDPLAVQAIPVPRSVPSFIITTAAAPPGGPLELREDGLAPPQRPSGSPGGAWSGCPGGRERGSGETPRRGPRPAPCPARCRQVAHLKVILSFSE